MVTESLARGMPVVVRDGTGAVEALAAGSARPAGRGRTRCPAPPSALAETDPAPLADLLRRWLTDPALRAEWRRRALAARERLPGWDATARTVLGYVAPDSTAWPAIPSQPTC